MNLVKSYKNFWIALSLVAIASGCSTPANITREPMRQKPYEMPNVGNKYVKNMNGITSRPEVTSRPVKCPKVAQPIADGRTWRGLVEEANACVIEKKWGLVESLGQELAQGESLSPWGFYFLSLSSQQSNEMLRALWMIEMAVKKSPGIGLLVYQRGRVFWDLKDYKKAVTEIEESAQLDPELTDAHLFLADLYAREKIQDKASRHYEAALKLEPKNFTCLVGLARIRYEQKESKAALELLERALSLKASDINVRLLYATVLETQEKDYERALVEYREISRWVSKSQAQVQLPFDMKDKIKGLESLVTTQKQAKSTERKPAQKGG